MVIQYFLPLTLVLWAQFASTSELIEGVNIDCGSYVESYTDDNSLHWSGDSRYLKEGEGKSRVATASKPLSHNHVMNSLRYFPDGILGQKYCYQFNDVPKDRRILVRASFYYGNYDNKLSPPTFDLEFDGIKWDTVETSSTEVYQSEVMYVVKADNNSLSVCVSQTKNHHFPFISALQVIHLDPKAYRGVDEEFVLYTYMRIAYAATQTVRYSNDTYDRIWYPSEADNGLVKVTNTALINTKDTDNDPPLEVLQNAVTTLNISYFIILFTLEHPFYITMYFSELIPPNSTEKRSFRVYQNDQPSSETIVPPYGRVIETNISNLNDSTSTTIYLKPDDDSTLPPLINALELFYINKLPIVGTSTSTPNPTNSSIGINPRGTNGIVTNPFSSSGSNSEKKRSKLPTAIMLGTTIINPSFIVIIWGIVGVLGM